MTVNFVMVVIFGYRTIYGYGRFVLVVYMNRWYVFLGEASTVHVVSLSLAPIALTSDVVSWTSDHQSPKQKPAWQSPRRKQERRRNATFS